MIERVSEWISGVSVKLDCIERWVNTRKISSLDLAEIEDNVKHRKSKRGKGDPRYLQTYSIPISPLILQNNVDWK